MSIKYAQLDADGKVIGVSYLSGIVEDDNLIQIEEDFNAWGKKFDKTENSWVDAPKVEDPIVEAKPTVEEKLEALSEIATATMMAVAELYERGGIE